VLEAGKRDAGDRRAASAALSLFVAASVLVWLCKLHALFASDDQWATYNVFFVAAVAAVAAVREALVLAVLCFLYWWRAKLLRDLPLARALLGAAILTLVAAVLLINIVNSDLVPRLGAPLTLPLIRYSDVFGSYDGRAAVWSWISGRFMLFAVVGSAIAAAAYLASKWFVGRFGPKLVTILLGAALLPTALVGFAKNPDWLSNITESGSLSLVRSIPAVGGAFAVHASAVPPFKLAGQDAGVPLPRHKIDNAIVFVIEAGAAHYLDIYGGHYSITPNLSALAGQSVVFDNAYAQATSSEVSLRTMLSSRYPPTWMGQSFDTSRMVLLPQLLRRSGMRTGLFHSSDIRFGETQPFVSTAGFETIHDYRNRRCAGALFQDPERDLGNDDACTLADMLGWIDSRPKQPFFALMWTFESHYPYFAEAPAGVRIDPAAIPLARARTEMGRYLGALRDADRVIGALVQRLRQTGRYDDTLIVVTGDHGQAFGQHRTYGNGGAVHEESVHVPLILINPQLGGPRRSGRLAGHIDMAPTVADALGLAVPPSWQGASLFRSGPQRPIYFTNMMEDQVIGYRLGSRKVFANFVRGSVDVFDLKADPGERNNLASAMPEQRVSAERDWLATWASNVDRSLRRD